ncbi:hypothetical protein Tco_0775796 [Tanacetum coccineum]
MFISYVRIPYKLCVFPYSLGVICSLHDVVHQSPLLGRRDHCVSSSGLMLKFSCFNFAFPSIFRVYGFGFVPGVLFVVFPFLLLLVSSTDGLVLIPTDTSWLRYSRFMVANPVSTSAFRIFSDAQIILQLLLCNRDLAVRNYVVPFFCWGVAFFIILAMVAYIGNRHIIRSSPSFGMANVDNLPNFLLIIQKASLASFVQPVLLLSPFLFSLT